MKKEEYKIALTKKHIGSEVPSPEFPALAVSYENFNISLCGSFYGLPMSCFHAGTVSLSLVVNSFTIELTSNDEKEGRYSTVFSYDPSHDEYQFQGTRFEVKQEPTNPNKDEKGYVTFLHFTVKQIKNSKNYPPPAM